MTQIIKSGGVSATVLVCPSLMCHGQAHGRGSDARLDVQCL